jgi:hypothetical protein
MDGVKTIVQNIMEFAPACVTARAMDQGMINVKPASLTPKQISMASVSAPQIGDLITALHI